MKLIVQGFATRRSGRNLCYAAAAAAAAAAEMPRLGEPSRLKAKTKEKNGEPNEP